MSELTSVPETVWDHDKAETLAYVLNHSLEFNNVFQGRQEIDSDIDDEVETKRAALAERKRGLEDNVELEAEIASMMMKRLNLQLDLLDVKQDISRELTRKESNLCALNTSNEILADYDTFYDTNPERFAQMTGEEFIEAYEPVAKAKAELEVIGEVISGNVRQIAHKTEFYRDQFEAGEQVFVGSAHIEVHCRELRSALSYIFGKDSSEAAELVREYDELKDAAYDIYTPKQLAEGLCVLNEKWINFIMITRAEKEIEIEQLLGR